MKSKSERQELLNKLRTIQSTWNLMLSNGFTLSPKPFETPAPEHEDVKFQLEPTQRA